MSDLLLLLAVLLSLSPVPAPQPAEPTETLIRLKVHAAAAPKPALRYQLLPELLEMNPGNPLQGYLKCFMEQNNFFFSKEAQEEREKLESLPLKELAKLKVRDYGGLALRQADYAARLDHLDWQTLPTMRREGIFLLIPEVQQLRTLSWALKVRFRLEIAEGRHSDALVTAKTLLALARHLSDHPTLISHLVATAVAYEAIGPLEEWLQQPGCPNFYWALTDLPRPLLNFRRGVQGERLILEKEFRLLERHEPMTAKQLEKVLDRLKQVVGATNIKNIKLEDYLTARTKDPTQLQAAKQRLVESGLAKDKVNQFPALQVVLVDDVLTFENQFDESAKVVQLPYWQAEPLLRVPHNKEEPPFFWLGNRIGSVRRTQARLEQRFALLRCVEALRLYAAAHQGKLPAKLADVQVPLPDDPMTGRPFLYQLNGEVASLRGTPPPSMAKAAAFRLHYQISLAK